jgi:hypothetical protein
MRLFTFVQDINLEQVQALHIHRIQLKLCTLQFYFKIADNTAKIVNRDSLKATTLVVFSLPDHPDVLSFDIL